MLLKNIFRGSRGKLLQGMAAGAAGFVVAAILYLPGWLHDWEAKTWDWRVRVMAAPSPFTDRIRLVMLDQKSLDWGRKENGLSWPWPREVYGAVIEFCRRAGARALVFDVLFTEPSKYGVADDRSLAEAIRDYGYFIGAVFPSRTEGGQKNWPPFAAEPKFRVTGFESWLAQTRKAPFPRASFPIEEISAAAGLLANVHLNPDADSVYRRASLFEIFDGRFIPSPGLASYLANRPAPSLRIRPGFLTIDNREIPMDDWGQVLLNFRGPSGTHKTYSAAAVIQSEVRLQNGEAPAIVPVEDFRDRYVLFGFSAPGLFDLRPTPVSGVYPGVEVHATMLDNLLAGDFLKPVSQAAVLFGMLFVALLAGMTTSHVSGILKSALAYSFFIALPVVLSLAAYRQGFWLPLVAQEAAVAATLLGAGLIYYTVEGRQKAYIKNAFRQYLSHAVIEELIRNPERLKLGGERRTLSIFFSDLEGFTAISEGLDPETLTNLLNIYLTAMTDIIHEEGGTVDKYEGDAIIAFWNAPLEQPDHAVRCVRAALKCQAKLAAMRPELHKIIGRDLKMRVGINSGQAVVGNLGSHSRFDYTMIGDAVNLASRLEGINKQFGTYMLISQATREQMGEAFPVREISRVAVVGRRKPVVVFEPMLPESIDAGRQAIMDTFSEALALFYQGNFTGAKAVFSAIVHEDPVARAYLAKCEELILNPPASWQGVWTIMVK